MRYVVLDTNCLIASLSTRSKSYIVWKGLQEGRFVLCVSNDIINEYREIITQKTNPRIAANVVRFMESCPYVKFFDPRYRFRLIEKDPDDNKFVDCAIIANATFIVSEDSHFRHLEDISFPQVLVIRLTEFVDILQKDTGKA